MINTDPTIENQLQLPIVAQVNGETVEFPRLDLDDLIRWAGEVRAKARADADAKYRTNAQLSEFDRQRLIAMVDQEVDIGTLKALSYTPAGVRKVLMVSRRKARDKSTNATEADAADLALLKRIHFNKQFELAQEVLSPPKPPEPKKDEPAAPAASDEGFTDSPIGDSTST